MERKTVQRAVFSALASLAALSALAQAPAQTGPGGITPGGLESRPAPAPQGGAAGISAGPIMVYPGLDYAFGRDTNLFSSETNRKSSNVHIISPWVRAEAKPGPHRFDATFRYDAGRYPNSRDDNYNDYHAIGRANLVFTGRADLALRGVHMKGHDPRGSTDRPSGNEPDVYRENAGDFLFGYGAPGARGRAELGAGLIDREYDNNRAFTIASDRRTWFVTPTFLWRVAPKTQVLGQVDRRKIDYDLPASTLDSTETRIYAGARWDITAITSGMLRFGRLTKDFVDPAREDILTSSWDLGARWSPLTYSVFDLTTSRQTNESTGVGDAILSSTYGATWSHQWASRFRTQLLGNWRTDEFQGTGVTREDNVNTFGAKAHYQFRRWLRFGTELTHIRRDSNINTFDYKRNLLLLTVSATL